MSVQAKLVWNYDSSKLTQVKEFDVYQIGSDGKPVQPALATTTSVPSISAPLVITLPDYGSYQIRVVAVAQNGAQGDASDLMVRVVLPIVTGLQQVS